MISGKKILAIIPARGQSKRLPRKNILPLGGKPLIAWTTETALSSDYIDKVIVSTEDHEIAEVALKYGADIPFVRPKNLATDSSSSIDVVIDVIEKLENIGEFYHYIILLQPTSPLRTLENINESIELLESSKSDAVISVCEAQHSPLWSNIISEGGDMSNFLDKSILNKRSQDLEQYYRINGAIYICDIDRIKSEKKLFVNKSIAYKMSQKQSIDIDTEFDLQQAEFFLNLLSK
jgi:CMP-N,N'-diacetyllegionaminic acid synthase